MDASGYFKGKKVTLMRIGLLGRGVGDAAYLARAGADVLVVDSAPQDVMQPSVDALSEFSNIRFKFGPYDLDDFRNGDMVLKGSGTPLDSPEIAEAKKNNIPVRMSADLFAELAHIPVIGITGTRGKSTTTYMLRDILERAGKKVLLGGNIRGVSTLALLPEATPEHVAVFELDSWQLQGFRDSGISPHISIFTTFFSDHLNYYHDDLDAYLFDKAAIFLNQKSDDVLILGEQCAGLIVEKYGSQIESKISVVGEEDLPADWTLQVPGAHNRYDAALARAGAKAFGVNDDAARKALEAFGGVQGRLQLVSIVDGVAYYNDTNSTTPEAGLVALHGLGEQYAGKIILIMGGADKNLSMDALLDAIPSQVKHVVLLSGTGTDRILDQLPEAQVYDNLLMAFEDARMASEPGDVILFSPCFASFGMFANEYDRGDQFENLVNSL